MSFGMPLDYWLETLSRKETKMRADEIDEDDWASHPKKKFALEALINEMQAEERYWTLAAMNWVGHDRWPSLTPGQQAANVELAKNNPEVRWTYLNIWC